jgi:hypothetical protein
MRKLKLDSLEKNNILFIFSYSVLAIHGSHIITGPKPRENIYILDGTENCLKREMQR